MTISWQANCVSFPCAGLGYSGSCALAHLRGSVRDPRTRLLVVMVRAEEQPGPAHWPCLLSHSPLLLNAGPYLHGVLRADGSSFLPICLLLLLLACPPLPV